MTTAHEHEQAKKKRESQRRQYEMFRAMIANESEAGDFIRCVISMYRRKAEMLAPPVAEAETVCAALNGIDLFLDEYDVPPPPTAPPPTATGRSERRGRDDRPH